MKKDSKFKNEALTFDDVLLVPSYSQIIPSETNVKTSLTKNIGLNIPLLSASMDTVTESRLAIAIALKGGIGIIHKNMSIENQSGETLHDEEGTPAGQESKLSPPSVDASSPAQSPQQSEKQAGELPNGQVAEFRQTLSALSRQLEIDRLTFLYQQLQADGNELPPLDRIASDIKGESALHPLGDQDIYSKRPLARLQGWISGLSFGVGRRAKKFSR